MVFIIVLVILINKGAIFAIEPNKDIAAQAEENSESLDIATKSITTFKGSNQKENSASKITDQIETQSDLFNDNIKKKGSSSNNNDIKKIDNKENTDKEDKKDKKEKKPKVFVPSADPIVGRILDPDVEVGVKPYGYVKLEAFFDTRQGIGSRENQVFLFPAPHLLDVLGRDINAHGEFHMTATETRVGVTLTGPTWCCIKTSGLIETDFRGVSDETNGTLRLRHAFGKIDWPNASLLYGQFWHPLFIVECFPHTLGFDYGAPMEPQARDPQLRLILKNRCSEIIIAALSQREFASNGPLGVTSKYIRDSVTPNFHLQFRRYFANNLIGIAGDFKRLVPRLVSDKNYKVNEHINSFVAEGFAAINCPPFSVRLKAVYAQNANDQLLISGFAVRTVDPVTDKRTYTNTTAAAFWMDSSYIFCCNNKEIGLFVGYTKNLGARHDIYFNPETNEPIIYALAKVSQNIDYAMRISGRYICARDPVRIGLELEFTRAAYGTPNRRARVVNAKGVNNLRTLFAFYYVF